MSARAGMVDLIRDVRLMTGAGTAAWTVDGEPRPTDAEVQRMLDRHVRRFKYQELAWHEDVVGGGTVSWTEATIPYRNLEAGTALILQDSLGGTVSSASYSVDYQDGRVTFTANQGGTVYLASGRSYDVYAASAEVLEAWAAAEAISFDFQSDASRFSRSQKAQALRAQAGELRRRARVGRASLVRRDG